MTEKPETPTLPPLVAAQHRAMPFTRLTDCGMDPADARRLLTDTAAGTPWPDAAAALAEAQLERARRAQESGHRTTARQAYRFAAAALMFAQMAYQTDTPEKRELYARHTAAVAALAPEVQRVEIPHRDGVLGGWLCLPAGTPRATVVAWGGLSSWGAAYLPVADAYTARGLACLLVEGPGQGLRGRLVLVRMGEDRVLVDQSGAHGRPGERVRRRCSSGRRPQP